MRSLFLGGPRAGEWEHTDGRSFHEVPVFDPEPVSFVASRLAEPIPVEVFVYRRVSLLIENGSLTVIGYVPNAVTVAEQGMYIARELLKMAADASTLRRALERHHRGLGGMTCDACGRVLFPREGS